MSKQEKGPLSILTPYKIITADSWPGKKPVEIHHASSTYDFIALLPGTDVLIAFNFTREMVSVAESLKLIQCPGAGLDNVDLTAVPKGCQVAVVYEHERAIAEWVVMAMIALNREILKADRDLRRGNWEMAPFRSQFSPELAEQTLGIIGLGRIGRQTARFAHALGMRVITATRTLPSPEEIQQLGIAEAKGIDALGQVLSKADFVLLSMPLTEGTRGMIGARELALMKPAAQLINVGRAELVEEGPLFQSLKTKQIKGAALDVWYHEPQNISEKPMPANLPFWELDNVLMTPHLSSLTTGMMKRRMLTIGRNIDHLALGEQLENVVYVGH